MAEADRDRTKLDNVGADRSRGQELGPLQRCGFIRHYREPTVDAAFPILSRPAAWTGCKAPQIAQREAA